MYISFLSVSEKQIGKHFNIDPPYFLSSTKLYIYIHIYIYIFINLETFQCFTIC